ncbi:MAG: hypothetical protein FWD40_11565 [Treponema sp.]|nr:hypothetical protein [Treponema sp.]
MKIGLKPGKIFFILPFLLLVNCSLLFGFDFSLRPKVFFSIPMGEGNLAPDGNEMYSTGGGGDIGLEIDFSTIWPNPLGLGYTLGVEGGMIINPMQGRSAVNVNFYSFGGALGLYFFPLSRLLTRADAALGIGFSARDGARSEPGLFWRAGGEIGFRFTPGFTIAANAGWRQYEESGGRLLNTGAYAGLTTQMTFQTGRSNNEGVSAAFEQYGAVFPAFIQLYQNNAIGNIVIRNNESAEIRDVRVSFRAAGYTASEFLCGSVFIIPRGRSAHLPLLADFSPEILRFTDNGRIIGELVIRYRFLGQEREVIRAVNVATYNRNRITSVASQPETPSRPLEDISALAAFISPTSPETLDFARFIAGLERNNRRTGHNKNLNYAIWLLEGSRASQIRVNNQSEEKSAISSVQFPAETLLFRSGSNIDLALLFASGLEGVGIRSAFLQTDDELLVALSLDVDWNAAETLFNGTGRILIVNDNVWLPLSMSALDNGFMACWTRAITILNQAFTEGMIVDFSVVENAWGIYPPAPLPELGRSILRTDNAALTREATRVIQQYVDQELAGVLRQVQTQINTSPSAALHNRLGIVQARIGRTAEAKAAYERAAGMGLVPAMTNRANLALMERDFTTAERFFRQALQRDSQNRIAARGLERVAESR